MSPLSETVYHSRGPNTDTFRHIIKFAHAMERKLQQHRAKGGPEDWKLASAWDLLIRLRGELTELEIAIERRQDWEDVQKECADVANCAMMISDAYRRAREADSTKPLPRTTV